MTLILRDLHFSYGPKAVLGGANLDLPAGSIFSILGSSGSGKSTLLRIVMLLLRASSGVVEYWNSESIAFGESSQGGASDEPHFENKVEAIRRRMSYSPQGYTLFPHLSILENVVFPLVRVDGVAFEAARDPAISLLTELGLEQVLHAKPWQLSGGQQQRVSIARAIIRKPRLIVLDEPTSALDVENIRIVSNLLRRSIEDGSTSVLVATHNLGFARIVSDQVVILDGGELSAPATTKDIDWELLVSKAI